jgi:phosphoglycerate dehydrogenase-like enzyme
MKLIIPQEITDLIQPHLSDQMQVIWADRDGNLTGDASDAEVYFNGFYLKPEVLHRVLAAAPAIRWQHSPSAGVDHLLTPVFLEREIILTNSAGVYAIPMAEFVMAFILNHAKQFSHIRALQAQKKWQPDLDLTELTDQTLLILGAGGIGRAIAHRASAFGMRVWGSRRRPEPLPEFERIVAQSEWRSLLPEADYVVITTPLTAETTGMIDAAALRSMKPSAYLINVARGAIVDEAALLTALRENWIAGAGLDTVWTEPLPPDSPFWTLPNVFITPHCSGLSPRIMERTIALFVDNLQRYCQNLPLRNVVNTQLGY